MSTTRTFLEHDHSGDVAVEAWGDTRAAMFENATRGLLGLMAWSAPASVVERAVDAAGDDAGALLVAWLSEVIRLAATHGEMYGEVRVDDVTQSRARGVLRGAGADGHAEQLRFDVKAATWHDLLVEERGGVHHCRVVFDL